LASLRGEQLVLLLTAPEVDREPLPVLDDDPMPRELDIADPTGLAGFEKDNRALAILI